MHQSKSNPTPAVAQSGHINDNELFDERTEKIIRLTALRLVRSGRFPQHEEDDIKQELRLSLWQQMPKFNPALSSRYTYANMVCNQTANTMCRNRARSRPKGPVRLRWSRKLAGTIRLATASPVMSTASPLAARTARIFSIRNSKIRWPQPSPAAGRGRRHLPANYGGRLPPRHCPEPPVPLHDVPESFPSPHRPQGHQAVGRHEMKEGRSIPSK